MTSNPVISALGRRLRLGVIGGGPGSFIGEVHRTAARLDDYYEVVAAVLSSDPARSRQAGQALGIARSYANIDELLQSESTRADGIDVIAIMTPNDSHYPLCCACLEQGLDIICDKPLTTSLADAPERLQRPDYQAFAILSMCRALHTLTTGTIASKPTAAAWAKTHLPSRWTPIIDAALTWQPGQPLDLVDACIELIRHTVARSADSVERSA